MFCVKLKKDKRKMTKSVKRSLKTMLLAASVLISACAFGGVKTAYANPTSTETVDLGTNGFSGDSKAAVESLIDNLGFKSYNALKKKVENDGAFTAAEYATAKTVTMGGVVWNVMYVSKADYTANGTAAGDMVVTLWQANSGSEKSKFSPAMSGALTDKYPINMYGASLVRSTLVGSQYTQSGSTLSSGTQNSKWATFTGGAYSAYLATPANMAWQETLSAVTAETIGREYSLVSDAWGTPSSENWQSEDNNYGARTGETLTAYTAWKNDKIWLPSLAEAGESDKNNGLWKTTAAQRKATSQTWLRSGPVNGTIVNVSALGTTGAVVNQTVFQSKNVRPAVHLNLALAAKAAGINTEHECTFGEWTVTKPATCTETGEQTRVCSGCGEVETQTIAVDPNAHDYESEFTVDTQATCTEKGSKSRHCSRCGEKTEVTEIEATGHSFTEYLKDEGGDTETATCDNGCGTKDTRQVEKPQDGGGIPAWVWIIAAVGGVAVVAAAVAVVIIVKKKRRG